MDTTFVKGFRTNMAYFPETTYGTFAVTDTNAYKVGGKVKSLNWTARHNIIKTGSIGDGRNYKQQLYGTYDANGSINWEISDLSFLRFGVGDIARFGTGATQDSPFVLLDAELTGVDDNGSLTALQAEVTDSYTKTRIRPFSILAYDKENAAADSSYNESVDLIQGAMMTDMNITASIGTPLMATTNFVAQKISFKRYLDDADVPVFTGNGNLTDWGNAMADGPDDSFERAQEAPLMFYQGKVYYTSSTGADVDDNELALVQSFSMGVNNNFRIYRAIGDKFIKMPTTGMRNFTCTLNLLFNLPDGTNDGSPNETNDSTTILEVIKNYLGYSGDSTFTPGQTLDPTTDSVPAETKTIKLEFTGTTINGNTKGAEINLYNATPEGFGHPIQLENGLVEIPVTFNVIGYPFNKEGDGSYTGNDGLGAAYANLNPIFKFWTT